MFPYVGRLTNRYIKTATCLRGVFELPSLRVQRKLGFDGLKLRMPDVKSQSSSINGYTIRP